MYGKQIGIDLGTANVLIHIKGQGMVLNEPSVVAIDRKSNGVLAVGRDAHRMVGRTPGNIVIIRPLKDGVIADFDITEAMLRQFLQKAGCHTRTRRNRILICTPAGVTPVELKAIREAVERTGGRTIYMEEEPKVAAVGAGLDIFQPRGNMVVDIGGGTTDVAVISLGDIVTASSIKVAGDAMDAAITRYIKDVYNLTIGERTSEEVKMKIASAYPGACQEQMDICGLDIVCGLPGEITIHSEEIREALSEPLSTIVEATHDVLERTPPELVADIYDQGLMLTGGGALLHGLDKLISEALKIPVIVAEDPMTCVVRGTAILLDNLHRAKKVSRSTIFQTRQFFKGGKWG